MLKGAYMKQIKLRELFSTFMRIGRFTFGGGYAMIPLIEKELVEQKGLLTEEEFIDIIAVVQGIPGVIAVNSSLFIGYKLRGILGALTSVLAISLPSILIILSIAQLLLNLQGNQWVEALFKGVRSAVVVLIFWAGYKMSKKAIVNYSSLIYTLGVVLGILVFKLHPIVLIGFAGIIGMITSITKTKEYNDDTD